MTNGACKPNLEFRKAAGAIHGPSRVARKLQNGTLVFVRGGG